MGKVEIEVPKKDFKNPDNLLECQCGNWHHSHYSLMDGDGNNACPSCTISFLGELIDQYKKEVKKAYPTEVMYVAVRKQMHSNVIGVSSEELQDSGYFDDINF